MKRIADRTTEEHAAFLAEFRAETARRLCAKRATMPDKPSEAAFLMMLDGEAIDEIEHTYPGVSMLGARGLV